MQTLPMARPCALADDAGACEVQIERLVAQLQRDNEAIARLIEDRQRRRRELLAAQERQLRALRDSDTATE